MLCSLFRAAHWLKKGERLTSPSFPFLLPPPSRSFSTKAEWGSEEWWEPFDRATPECFPKGWKVAGITAGLKESGRKDLALFYSEKPAEAAAVFTTNKFPAAPIQVTREQLAASKFRALVVNSGQANACTGAQGLEDARTMTDLVRKNLKIESEVDRGVAVMSTGVIGVPLKMPIVSSGIFQAVTELGSTKKNWQDCAEAIMTTDTRAKVSFASYSEGKSSGRTNLLGLAKGAGMIHPNMATLLCFVSTDANIAPEPLQAALRYAVDRSFNSIDVDGDTSTNDTLLCLANAASGATRIDSTQDPRFPQFQASLTDVCVELAQKIVFDAEGASRFVAITVRGAKTHQDAMKVGQTVAQSSLFKCAMWGGDANWGRAICAVGYSGLSYLELDKIDLFFAPLQGDPRYVEPNPSLSVPLVLKGQPISTNRAQATSLCQAHKYINVVIDLGVGDSAAKVYTCDLSPAYVKFNGAYTT